MACNYNQSAQISDSTCIYDVDCQGNCGGLLIIDQCGVCNGNNESCVDCLGEVNGDAIEDNCGACDNDYTNDCNLDCMGEWGGNSQLDICGVCNGNGQSCLDCLGNLGGNALIDECGVCSGGETGVDINNSCTDCFGDVNGDAVEDNCGVCDNDYTNDCIQDCNGNWGGDALIDECGVCEGNNFSCTDCLGVINGNSFLDSCGNCIEFLPSSWKIKIEAELILSNPDSDTLTDESSNYLGADIQYTDGFDGIGIDVIESPFTSGNPVLLFSFYHDDWYDAVFDGTQYYYFNEDIRNHNYSDFLGEGKTWNAELKTENNWYSGVAKLTFSFLGDLTYADISVSIVGSNLSGNTYLISDGSSINDIIIPYNSIVYFDINISNLCY